MSTEAWCNAAEPMHNMSTSKFCTVAQALLGAAKGAGADSVVAQVLSATLHCVMPAYSACMHSTMKRGGQHLSACWRATLKACWREPAWPVLSARPT